VSEVVLTETQQRITDALHRLTSAQRTVMAWRLDGFDYSEIARALDMTPEAVRQNISRARKNLISILDLSKGDAHE
jgi:RNA polymerase sigma-70 factor (ECF subfamily)